MGLIPDSDIADMNDRMPQAKSLSQAQSKFYVMLHNKSLSDYQAVKGDRAAERLYFVSDPTKRLRYTSERIHWR